METNLRIKIELNVTVLHTLSTFLDGIRDYELELASGVYRDERDSAEFAKIFMESEEYVVGCKPMLETIIERSDNLERV